MVHSPRRCNALINSIAFLSSFTLQHLSSSSLLLLFWCVLFCLSCDRILLRGAGTLPHSAYQPRHTLFDLFILISTFVTPYRSLALFTLPSIRSRCLSLHDLLLASMGESRASNSSSAYRRKLYFSCTTRICTRVCARSSARELHQMPDDAACLHVWRENEEKLFLRAIIILSFTF